MRRPVFVGTAGAVAALLLGTAGCAGDPEPRFAPPSDEASPSASESASPSESATPREVAVDWVEEYTASLKSGDSTRLRYLTAEQCETCDEFILGVERIADAGGSISTDGWRRTGAEIDRKASNDREPVVRGALIQAAGTTIPSPGADPFSFDRRIDTAFFRLREEGGAWKVATIYFAA